MNPPTDRPNPLLRLLLGPLVWTLHFVLVYALVSIGCAAGWQNTPAAGIDLLRFLLAGVSIIAVLALLWLLKRCWSDPLRHGGETRFVPLASAGLALLSLIAVLWATVAIPLMLPCL